MAYEIHIFSSDETKDLGIGLESSKMNDSQLSEYFFVKKMKLLVGNDENLPDSTYALPLLPEWKNVFIKFIQNCASIIPNLNELIAFVNDIEENKYLGISFNHKLDFLEKKKLLFKMKEYEEGISADEEFSKFIEKYGELLNHYRPFAYTYGKIIRFGIQERMKRICRYCGRKMPETTFRNISHTIPRSIGNISYITNDECDKCNAVFGRGIEQDFLNYISIYRTLASRFENHPNYKTNTKSYKLEVDCNTNGLRFNVTDNKEFWTRSYDDHTDLYVNGGYVNYHNIYRALVKFALGMLPKEELPNFEETIKWVNGEDCLPNLPFVKETVYQEPELHPFINMFIRTDDNHKYPYIIAEFHASHLQWVYAIPGCNKDSELKFDIVNDYLSLVKDTNLWRDLPMNRHQPVHRNLHVTLHHAKPLKGDKK